MKTKIEIDVVKPVLVICLGAVAGSALIHIISILSMSAAKAL